MSSRQRLHEKWAETDAWINAAHQAWCDICAIKQANFVVYRCALCGVTVCRDHSVYGHYRMPLESINNIVCTNCCAGLKEVAK
jgi:hypothetical protein